MCLKFNSNFKYKLHPSMHMHVVISSFFYLDCSRCAEFPDCPGDQVWDGAQCVDLECDPRETPSYSLTGQDDEWQEGNGGLWHRWPNLCVRGWLGERGRGWGVVWSAQHQGLVWGGPDIAGQACVMWLQIILWIITADLRNNVSFFRRLQGVTVYHMSNVRPFWR